MIEKRIRICESVLFGGGGALKISSLGQLGKLLFVGCLFAGAANGQDNMVVFETEAAGQNKSVELWGLDTAWLWDMNVARGVQFMGKPQVDVIRFSFTGDTPIVNGDLSGTGLTEFNDRMDVVDTYTDFHTALYLNTDTDTLNSYYQGSSGVDPRTWSELIAVTTQKCEDAGRVVLSVAPFNEPDGTSWQGNATRLGDVCWWLRWSGLYGAFSYSVPDAEFINLYGASTLNNSNANTWYNTLNGWGYLEEGNTHQLAGSFDDYAAFYQNVEANSDIGTNDELHNVMEAMVGAEYGMDVGIWWGTAERARGEFVVASDGDRLAYVENRNNWTAASVYRAPNGEVKAFVGESERQAMETSFRFLSKDRPVFYDGHGPQRSFDVNTTGDTSYWTANHHNAERVINVTWGEDVQPAIDGRYYLVSRSSNKVMEVVSSGTADGDNVQQNSYSGALNQQWDVVPMPLTSGGDYSYYSVVAAHSGKAAEIPVWNFEDGGNVQQSALAGSNAGSNQQWVLEYVEDGWFSLRNRWSGRYLDVSGGSTQDGANLLVWPGNGQYNQQWRMVPVGADPTDSVAPATPANVVATANDVSVSLVWTAGSESDLDGYTIMRSDAAGGPYEIIARGVTANTYTDNLANQARAYYYVVSSVDQSLNRSGESVEVSASPSGQAAMVARYAFNGNVDDATLNDNDGEVGSSYQFASGGVDGQTCLVLNQGYATVPSEVVNQDQLTVASWVYWNGGSSWQRIFDFGNGTDEYLFLTPSSGSGTLRFAMKDGGPEQLVNASSLPIGQWAHVAVVLGSGTAQLYVDGVLAASTNTTIKPSDFNPLQNYIGRSQYVQDSLFNGAVDELRIYNYALSSAEVANLASATVVDPL